MNLFDPPAVVREIEGFKALWDHIAAQKRAMDRDEKLNLERALDIGQALVKVRPLCKVGEWQEHLGKVGLSRQRANDFMWGASQPPEVRGPWESINDLRRAREDAQDAPDESDTSTGGQAPPPSNPAAGLAPPPPVAAQRCVDCLRKGRSGIDCEACKNLNAPRGGNKAGPAAAGEPRREPGSDDGELDEEFEARYGYDLKLIDKAVRPLWRQYRKVAKVYGLRLGQTVTDVDPLLQPAVRAFGEAKTKLRLAVLTARKRMMAEWRQGSEIPE